MKLLFTALCFLSVSAFAHQDMIIMQEGEKLVGLPEIYEPARFNKQSMVLRLGNNSVSFPDCFRKFFVTKESELLVIAASWYHNSETLPPYLTISIGPNGILSQKAIMFNMDTLLPIDTGFSYGETQEEKECVKQFIPTKIHQT